MASISEQAERAFAQTFVNTIASQPVTYPNDYQQPPAMSLKRIHVLQIPVPPPPERKATSATSGSSSGTVLMSVRFPSNASWSLFSNRAFSALISVTFKSLKPSASFALPVQPADPISSIKEQLLAAHPNAPPPDAQRLLFKGKALSDSKLLQEYAVKDGDVINLMLKPGTNWDPSKPTESTPTPQMAAPMPVNPLASVGGSLDPQASRTSRHQRIPSVVLSPSPSNDGTLPEQKDIVLTVDAGLIASPSSSPEKTSTYQTIMAKPEFWYNLHQFLRKEFTSEADVHVAFEDFLAAAKGNLTASEIAKIRDHVGIVGMAGT